MTSDPRRICWDAWAFTELLNRFSPHHRPLLDIVRLAAGDEPRIEIVTSIIAAAEVAGLLRHAETGRIVGRLDVTDVELMWNSSPVVRLDVTRGVAERARDIVRASEAARPRRRIIRGADAVYLGLPRVC